jgi:hypothetical protein
MTTTNPPSRLGELSVEWKDAAIRPGAPDRRMPRAHRDAGGRARPATARTRRVGTMTTCYNWLYAVLGLVAVVSFATSDGTARLVWFVIGAVLVLADIVIRHWMKSKGTDD